MMKLKDVPPSIRGLFPWALFLALAALLAIGAWAMARPAHADEDVWACYGAARYEAMSSGWTPCNEMNSLCDKIRAYLITHSRAEARAEAIEKHVPQWIINKAERCLP